MTRPPVPGSTVIVRDERWRVARVDAFDGCSIVALDAPGGARIRVIEPFERVLPAAPERVAMRRRRAVLQAALAAIAAERPPTGLWTAAGASIDLHSYQLEPALAVLGGATRVLLADAVGLGKTIQAGLILSELRTRGLVDRALILCPPGMRAGWADELDRRFGIPAAVVDQQWLSDNASTLPPGVNPWAVAGIAVASIDLVKRREVIAALAAVPIDMVIADEAHHLTPGTERGDAVQALASRSPWCVLLSATPHSGDDAAFGYLTRLGGHGEPLTIFRRSRADAGLSGARCERVAAVRPSAAEAGVMTAVERYTRAIWQGRGGRELSAQLLAITIARRAASSPLALERTLRRRLALLADSAAAAAQLDLPWDEECDADDSGAPDLLATPGLESGETERAVIANLLESIDRCRSAAKLRWILRLLRRIGEPAIVFSEYRDTLDALVAVLPSDLRAVLISGAASLDERRHAVDAFNRGDADVLLATDAAGEGLNLHHRCRLVIDVELPWSPLRLEQRVGRVDRIGQRRRVHAIRLFHPGTIEERVLDRLQLRRSRAGWLDHPSAIDERMVAASILGSGEADRPAVRVVGVSVAGSEHERSRVMRQRKHARPHAGTGPVAAAPRHRRTTRLLALHTVTCVTESGSIVAEHPCAHSIDVDVRRATSRSAVLKEVSISPQLRSASGNHASLACDAVNTTIAPLRRAVAERIDSIRTHLASQRRRSVQPSLFDRRAEDTANSDGDAVHTLDAALNRRLHGIVSPARAGLALTRLVALWPLDRR